MDLPEEVRIGPYTYKVRMQGTVLGEHNEELYGNIAYGPQELKVQGNLSRERTVAVLAHEIIHGIDEYMHIGLREKQVRRLGAGLTALFVDNPALHDVFFAAATRQQLDSNKQEGVA